MKSGTEGMSLGKSIPFKSPLRQIDNSDNPINILPPRPKLDIVGWRNGKIETVLPLTKTKQHKQT